MVWQIPQHGKKLTLKPYTIFSYNISESNEQQSHIYNLLCITVSSNLIPMMPA